jgi:nitrilase
VTTYPEFVMAAVQAAPVYFDREASTEKACRLIAAAGARGATIAAFGECWLPGYPFFCFSRPTPLWWQAAAEYLANGVEIPGPETERLCQAAREAGIDVVIGVAERDPVSHGTAYCTLLFIGREGEILGRHRKIKPTLHERAVWGEGDAVGLSVHQRSYARISGLNCWEHNAVLPGYVLMAQGTQVHIAAWPGREPEAAPEAPISVWSRQTLLSRAFASQSGAYVIMAGGLCRPEDIPERYHELIRHPYTGDSAIIDPRGEIIAGPVRGEEIVLAVGSMEAVYAAKVGGDVGGHYSRPDLLQVLVNRHPLQRVVEMHPPAEDALLLAPPMEPAAGG